MNKLLKRFCYNLVNAQDMDGLVLHRSSFQRAGRAQPTYRCMSEDMNVLSGAETLI